MADPSPDATLPIDVQKQIASRGEEFRRAWAAAEKPSMEEVLANAPLGVRANLLRTLLAVEMEYRRNGEGKPLDEAALIAAHPSLASDLKRAFQELRTLGTDRAGAHQATVWMPPSKIDLALTVDHTPSRTDSHGLHIRCPHCSNPVELLADTPYEDINCRTCGSTFSLVEREAETKMAAPLKTIGRFDLVARLGVGGFGTVWKARDRELDRVVALKIPRRGQLSPVEVEQFYREARSAAQLRHPHIVPVHEVGRDGETLFIVSDFVRGVSLSSWLSGRRPSPLEVAEMCTTICDALHHAHEHGVIHRDMKPSNLMIDQEGQPSIMDFGLAKREVGEISMTVEGQILGTPAYMSPEQAAGEGRWIDRRTDLYSMGVIVFEMLTGELPFRGNHQMQIHQRLTEDPPDPRTLNVHIPRDLSTICLKCLERDPNRRYSTARELKEEFERFIDGEPIMARPLSRPARLVRWAKRKPLLATVIGLVTFLATAGPIAALVIELQRARLEALVEEKDNLIVEANSATKRSLNTISQLQDQLATWEGQANPWELWPPKRDDGPRQNLAGELLQHASSSLEKRLTNAFFDGTETAQGFVGLAMLADAKGQTSDATDYYEQARQHLQSLHETEPTNSDVAATLADCHSNLALLIEKTDRLAAIEHLESARSLHEQFAKASPGDLARQIAWLEAELHCATMLGFDKSQSHLQRAGAIAKSLDAKWPNRPADLYRLACFLRKREPTLLPQEVPHAP